MSKVQRSAGNVPGPEAACAGRATKAQPKAVAHPPGARDMALLVLQRVERGEAVQAALDQVLRSQKGVVEARDNALCTEMVYGYLRTALRLDAVLDMVLAAPEKLPEALRIILRLGVHSLLFLHKVPPHAVLHACVDMTQRKFGKKLAGLVNAVLRSVQRLGDEPQHEQFYAAKARTPLEARCAFYGLPLWIGKLWNDAYGEAAAVVLMARAFAQPWACVRVNACHAQCADVRAALLAQQGRAVGGCGIAFAPGQTPHEALGKALVQWHDEGALSWQAAGSLAVLEADAADLGMYRDVDQPLGCEARNGLAQWWRDPVWDACAGQGGKSLALLERGATIGLCSDVHVGRLRHLKSTAQRLGLPVPPVLRMSADAVALRQWPGTILLDVPCSGLGTLARRPEIRNRRTAEHVRALVDVQRTMLRQAWQILAPGKHVVYMTCTLNPAENEDQVNALLRAEPAAALVYSWQTPHAHPWLEGMYVAVLRKAARGA